MIFEFSNWTQLVGVISESYPDIRIRVNSYFSESIRGTKIEIYDVNNNDIYYTGFVSLINSTVIPNTASLMPNTMVDVINSYGFPIKLIEPTVLPPHVITILKGLYMQGYNYISLQYKELTPWPITRVILATQGLHANSDYVIISDAPEYNKEDFTWVKPNTSYSIALLIQLSEGS